MVWKVKSQMQKAVLESEAMIVCADGSNDGFRSNISLGREFDYQPETNGFLSTHVSRRFH